MIIIVHGGAWAIPDALDAASVRGCECAVRAGFTALAAGRSALDAVEAAVRVLEDDPTFDAGHGSVLNAAGRVEMDALIMDGATLRSGAVACVTGVSNPVSLARMVMDKTKHALVCGEGANLFARQMGVPEVPAAELVTPGARAEWERFRDYGTAVDELFTHDTVGAVAMDNAGNVAAATSTGGITAKMVGRVGDSPLVGCGGIADNEVGGVSTTGHGESIMRTMLASQVLAELERGAGAAGEGGTESPTISAARAALERMRARTGGCGGLVALDAAGRPGAWHTTAKMAWACMRQAGEGDEVISGIRVDAAAVTALSALSRSAAGAAAR
jgi:beta-aspartyl-peptidase (threonine type)